MKTKKLIINDKDEDTIDIGDINEYFNGIIIVLNDDLPEGYIIYNEGLETWECYTEISCGRGSIYYNDILIELFRELKSKHPNISFEVISFKS